MKEDQNNNQQSGFEDAQQNIELSKAQFNMIVEAVVTQVRDELIERGIVQSYNVYDQMMQDDNEGSIYVELPFELKEV